MYILVRFWVSSFASRQNIARMEPPPSMARFLRGGAPKRNFGERRGHRGGKQPTKFRGQEIFYPKKCLSLEASLAVRLEALLSVHPLIYSSSISDSGRPVILIIKLLSHFSIFISLAVSLLTLSLISISKVDIRTL